MLQIDSFIQIAQCDCATSLIVFYRGAKCKGKVRWASRDCLWRPARHCWAVSTYCIGVNLFLDSLLFHYSTIRLPHLSFSLVLCLTRPFLGDFSTTKVKPFVEVSKPTISLPRDSMGHPDIYISSSSYQTAYVMFKSQFSGWLELLLVIDGGAECSLMVKCRKPTISLTRASMGPPDIYMRVRSSQPTHELFRSRFSGWLELWLVIYHRL